MESENNKSNIDAEKTQNADESPLSAEAILKMTKFDRDISLQDLSTYIEILDEYRKACQVKKNFMQAEATKKKIEDIKSEVLFRKKKEQEYMQLDEIRKLEMSQNQEMQEFHNYWNQRIDDYDKEADSIEAQMIEKHKTELAEMEKDLMKSYPLKMKASPQRLNYLKIQENLAKQKEYAEAHKIKLITDALEKKEKEESLQARDAKIKSMLQALALKQQGELQVLQKRKTTGRDELLKLRSVELEKLLQKFSNSSKEVELANHIDRSRFELVYKNFVYGSPLFPNSKGFNSTFQKK